jgi:hypothetical protein
VRTLGISYIGQIARVIDSRVLQVTDPDAMRGVLASPEGFLAGWTHYAAFDVVVGRWIWRTAREEGRGVSGREKLPVGGHEKSPVAAMKIPHWWPPDLPTSYPVARLAWPG